MIRLVVTDLDNTLYSWVDYIVPAVEALVDSVCVSTGYPRIKVVQALKAVYEKYESNEYPYVLQESAIYEAFPEFDSFDRLVIEPAQGAFRRARDKYLKLYPGVLDTLQELGRRGLPVVALTDAPRNPAEIRTKRLGVDGLLAGLYTLPGFQFPASPEGEALVAKTIVHRDRKGHYRAACNVVELPREAEKPSPLGLARICGDFGVAPSEVLVVGDSLRKDVGVARAAGAVDCWAEYGTYISVEYRERLDTISARAVTRRHAASVLEGHGVGLDIHPTHSLSSFGQLLAVIDGVKRGAAPAPPRRAERGTERARGTPGKRPRMRRP